MADRHPLKRSLWGIDPAAVEQWLQEQEAPLRREREALERAVTLAETEVERLKAQCEHLARQIRYAEQRLTLARQSVQRQQSLPPTQALTMHQHLRTLEREHMARMADLEQQEAALRTQIDQQRRSLHRWVMALLQSVAERDSP